LLLYIDSVLKNDDLALPLFLSILLAGGDMVGENVSLSLALFLFYAFCLP
jgi:hypothetical protein